MNFSVIYQIVLSFELHPTHLAFPAPLVGVRYPMFPQCRVGVVRVATVHADVVVTCLLVNPHFMSFHSRLGREFLLTNFAFEALFRVALHVPFVGTFGRQLDATFLAGEFYTLVNHVHMFIQIR